MRRALLIATLLSTAIAAAAPPRSALNEGQRETPDILLARGRQAYDRQEFDGAIRILEPLLYPTPQVGSDSEPLARKLLAVSYLLEGNTTKAENEFQAIVQLDPSFRLSRVLDPPKAYAFFEDIRRKNEEKLVEIAEQKRRDAEEAERRRKREREEEEERIRKSLKPVIIERTVEKHNFLLNFVPFGAGQFQNGDRKKALFFTTTQTALAVSSAALWGYLVIAYQNGTKKVTPADGNTPFYLNAAGVILGALFWADVVVGVVDALRNYRAEIITEKKVPAPAAAPAPRSVRLTPFFAPSAGGLSIQGAF